MMGRMRRAAATLVLLALAVPPAAAQDRDRGLVTLRRARRALLEGRLDEARALAEEARVDLVGYPLVAHVLGDVHARAGDWRAAIDEYRDKGMVAHPSLSAAEVADLRHRAHLQSALVRAHGAEAELREAGVPLDAAAVPDEQLPPGLVGPLQQGIEEYERARESLERAMRLRTDARSRESLVAIHDRLEQLREMLEQARDQQQDEESQDDQQQDDEQQQDEQQRDGGGQDEPQDPDEQDQDQSDGEQQDGEQPRDEQAPPSDDGEQAPSPPRALSPEQIAQLVERLQEQAEEARELEQRQRAAARAAREEEAVEKDW